MNFHPLPDNWEHHRLVAQRGTTHVLGQARFRHDGLFDLVPLPGGFGTPPVGPQRERVRLVGGSMFIERVVGDDVRELVATTQVEIVVGNTIRGQSNAFGFEPDPDFLVGGNTPPLGDPDELIVLDSVTSSVLGEWYLVGQRAMEKQLRRSLAPRRRWVGCGPSTSTSASTLLRSWVSGRISGPPPVMVASTSLTCLSARGVRNVRDQPSNWTAPFGATLTFAELDIVEEPLGRAVEFFLHGLAYPRG